MNTSAQTGCDKAIALAAPPCPQTRTVDHPRMVLATTILASSLAFIDGSVVNVGLPAIGRSLGTDGSGLSWIVNGYLLPLSALLLLGGAALLASFHIAALACAVTALASAACAFRMVR